MSATITYLWNNRYWDGVTFQTYCLTCSLGDELGTSLCGEWRDWVTTLPGNLAMASLLCKSADVAYARGHDDGQEYRYVSRNAHPERAL